MQWSWLVLEAEGQFWVIANNVRTLTE